MRFVAIFRDFHTTPDVGLTINIEKGDIVCRPQGGSKAEINRCCQINAPWHKKAKRLIESEKEYADIRKSVTIVSLPPYSPDLNPIEQIWRITRREKTHNRYWKNLETLVTVLDSWFASFTQPNKKLASLCSFSW